MDGPSVNLAFKRKLELDLEKHKKTLMDVGTCPLYVASIELDIDLDQIVLDLFGFFKYSAKSRRMLKHISTRWISI